MSRASAARLAAGRWFATRVGPPPGDMVWSAARLEPPSRGPGLRGRGTVRSPDTSRAGPDLSDRDRLPVSVSRLLGGDPMRARRPAGECSVEVEVESVVDLEAVR